MTVAVEAAAVVFDRSGRVLTPALADPQVHWRRILPAVQLADMLCHAIVLDAHLFIEVASLTALIGAASSGSGNRDQPPEQKRDGQTGEPAIRLGSG